MAYHPYYWSTSLLLNFEDAGATTFTDISPTPKTPLSVNGNAQNSVTQYKSGAKSLALDGTGDWIDYTSHADFDFGSGAFTVNLWWRPTVAAANANLIGLNIDAASVNADVAWYVRQGSGGKLDCGFYVGGVQKNIQSTTTFVVNTWYNIEYSRDDADNCRIFINGVLDASVIVYTGTIQTPASRLLRIGKFSTSNNYYPNGYIDGLAITKGYAVHTTTFTPELALFEASPPGVIEASLTSPMGTASIAGGASAAMAGPMGTMQAVGSANSSMTGPMGLLVAVGHDATGEREFIGTAPMGTLSVLGGATAAMTAPMGTLVSSMTVPVSITAELVGPMGTLVASATADVMMRADLRLTSAGSLVTYFGAQAMLTAPMGALSAGATVGALMSFAGSAPVGLLSAMMTSGIVMRAELTAPMIMPVPSMRATLAAPMGTLIAIGTATVTIVYETYAMNLKPANKAGIHEVTYWDTMPFDGIVRHGNSYYGWGPGGLHLIGGTTDDSEPIAWSWKTGITDFGTAQRKPMREMLFSGRIGPTAVASVSIGERADVTYSYSTPRGQLAQNYRVKTGKGLKDAFYSVGLSGSDVGDVDSVVFGIAESTRRI